MFPHMLLVYAKFPTVSNYYGNHQKKTVCFPRVVVVSTYGLKVARKSESAVTEETNEVTRQPFHPLTHAYEKSPFRNAADQCTGKQRVPTNRGTWKTTVAIQS